MTEQIMTAKIHKLKKYPLTLLMTLIYVVTLSGCTSNNGDIGKFFGQWKLSEMEFTNIDPTTYTGTIYWNFQNSTIGMMEVCGTKERSETFGNWEDVETGGEQGGYRLKLDFPDEEYPPLSALKLPRHAELSIERLTGNEMVVTYHQSATEFITYHLRKWGY